MNKLPIKIAPSLLSANFANLTEDIRKCEKGGADILHFDSMDGHFVPNITIGPMLVSAVRSITKLPLSCHLMIENPDKYITDYIKNGADYVSVHVEGNPHLHRSLSLIKEKGAKAGIALNPVTPLEFAYESAEFCDFVLLMSVNPGFGGQSFIPNVVARIKRLRDFLDNHNLSNVEIEVDGGIKLDNVSNVVTAGANILVSGTGIFNGNIIANLESMRNQVAKK